MTSGVAYHHHPWTAHTVGNIGRAMTSPPLDRTHGQTTSGVACHHCLWVAHTVERRRAWHAIIALGRQTRSNDVRHGKPSSPLGSTHDRTMLGVACHHSPWTANTVKQRQAWHATIAFRHHTRSNDVGRCMPSSRLGSTHGRMTSVVACNHRCCTAQTNE